MENASDAIIMAGAMLIFVLALTVAMTVFSQARATVDTVLYASDPTSYYEYLDTENNNVKNRIVGWETVIPTLYKYYKENYTIVFLEAGSEAKGLTLYETQTNPLLWSGNTEQKNTTIPPIASKYPGIKAEKNYAENKIPICSFDVDEETKRHEPWTGSTEDYKENLTAFIEGKEFSYPDGSGKAYKYSGFINELGEDAKFRETIGEYSMRKKTGFSAEIQEELDKGIRNNKNKRVIVYQIVTEE